MPAIRRLTDFFYYNLNIRTNNGYEVTIGDGSSVAISNDLTIENPDAAGGGCFKC